MSFHTTGKRKVLGLSLLIAWGALKNGKQIPKHKDKSHSQQIVCIYIYIRSASFAHWQQHSTTSPFPDCKIKNPRAPIEAERLQQQKGLVSISLVQSRDYLISNMILKIRVDFRAAILHHDCVSNLRFALLGSQKTMQLCELRLEPIIKMQQVLQL